MRKKIFLAIFLLSILTITNAHALENGVSIPLVADMMTGNGEEGAMLNAQVIVTNGTGHVFVDTNPYTQVDLQGSARIAAMVASDVLGVDEKSYDFYYIIEVGSPIIGGPSAGGALTVATIAAMNNWKIKPGIAMTGMIDPDQTIGPVGGIPFKLEAAAAKNTTLFLVPRGQLIVNITNTTPQRRGPFITTQTNVETVNLNDLGKKLKVSVKEIDTIQDAVLEFTGYDINKPSINKTVFTSIYLNRLEPLAFRLRNESKTMYNNSSSLDNDLIKNAANLQNKADGLISNKKYYAATSLYFESMINILTAQWGNEYDQNPDKEQYISNLTNIVETQIQSSEKDVDKYKSNGITDVEIIGAAESRIVDANNTLGNIKDPNNVNNVISSLAFAYERAKTAQWWLTLAAPSEKIIPEDVLIDRSGWYLGQAQSINTYVQALISESEGHSINNFADTTLPQKEIDRGYYSGAIFDSLQAMARLSTAIELLGVEDPSIRINQSARAAEAAINEARSNNIEPTLAVSAYEYGEILTEPYDKISQYSYAKMVAKTTESLYSHTLSGNQSKPTTTVLTQKAPAFGAIISLIIVLIIRKMRK